VRDELETTFKQNHATGREPSALRKRFNSLQMEQKNRPTKASNDSLKVAQKLSRVGTDTVKKYKHNLN
jgi:hypothetical protein